MYISFKVWYDTCKKMLLWGLWYRCLDLAIYTDLFSLRSTFLENVNYNIRIINLHTKYIHRRFLKLIFDEVWKQLILET